MTTSNVATPPSARSPEKFLRMARTGPEGKIGKVRLRLSARPPGSPTCSVIFASVGRGALSAWTGTVTVADPLASVVALASISAEVASTFSSSRPMENPSSPLIPLVAAAWTRTVPDTSRPEPGAP